MCAKVSGNSKLNFQGGFDISEIISNQKKVIAGFVDLKKASESATVKNSSNSATQFNSKPLTDYQKEIVRIKDETLALAKAKQAQLSADKAASLVLQKALADERLAREAVNLQASKNRLEAQETTKSIKEQALATKKLKDEAARTTTTKNRDFAPEVASQNALANSTARATSIMSAQVIAKARLTAESAKQAIAEGNLRTITSSSVSAAQSQVQATKSVTLSKKQLAQALSDERLIQANSTKELRNNSREQLNAKGSIEQRKASIERLTIAYSRLSVAERESASGTRMAGIIKGITDQVKQLESATKSSNSALKEQEGTFSGLKTQLLGMAAAYVSLAAVKAVIHTNAEVSDSFTDVQRTAKSTNVEIDALIEKLKGRDTRTSLAEQLDIGFIGGRLGVAQKDLFGFIDTVDQLAVVLKKELPGGADAVAESLGKMISVYKITQREGITLDDALKKTGSSLLDVAHNGPVTVKYLQDFALGAAGAAQTAKVSLPTMVAYGAVLSEAGIIASSASISVTRLFGDLSTKREKYFAIAQLADSTLTLKEFTNLINTDTNKALELFFKGMKAGNPPATEFNDRLKTLGFTTGKVKNAITALAENQDKLFAKTAIANKGYQEGTSLAHNFELANNSLAASFSKLGNFFANMFTSSEASRNIGIAINSLFDVRSESEKLSQAYINNKHNFDATQSAITPLLVKYDKLKSSTKLSKDEQIELKNITKQIGDLLPSVTTKIDDYGNAIAISRDKISSMTKAQRDLLELQNRGSIEAANKEFELLQKNIPLAKKAALDIAKDTKSYEIGSGLFKFKSSSGLFGFGKADEKEIQERLQKNKDGITKLSGQAYEAAKTVRSLGGTLTKAQQDILDYYEVANKIKPKAATIFGEDTGEEQPPILDIKALKKEIKDLTAANVLLKGVGEDFKKNVIRIRELKKQLKEAGGGVDTTGRAGEKAFDSLYSKRNALQKKIDDLIATTNNKQLTSDDEEIASTKKKYEDLRKEASKYYADLNKKIKTPKERAKLGVTLSGLDKSEEKALQEVEAKRTIEAAKLSIDAQKQLFNDYEQYKTQFGQTEATKRFGADLKGFKTYAEYVKSLLPPESDQSVAANKLRDLLKKDLIPKADKDQINAVNKLYDIAYQSALTYYQKVQLANEDFEAKKLALGKNVTKEQIDNLLKEREERKRALNQSNADEKSGFNELMMHFNELTRDELIKRLNLSKDYYRNQYRLGLLTAKQLEESIGPINSEIDKLIGNSSFNKIAESIERYKKALEDAKGNKGAMGVVKAQKEVTNSIVEGAHEITNALGGVVGLLGELGIGGQELQDTFAGVAKVVSGAGELAKGISSADPIAIVSGSINLLSAAVGLFNTKDKKLQKQIDNYKKELDSLGKSFAALDRQVSRTAGVDVYSVQQQQIANLQQQQQKLIDMRNAEGDKKKTDQGRIDDLQNQIDDIPNKIQDIQDSISQNLIQGTFRELASSLADALTSAFTAGEDGIAAMDKSFDQFIANALKNSYKLAFLEPVVKQFTDDLTAFAKANNNSVVGFDFEKYKSLLANAGKDFNNALTETEKYFKDLGIDKNSPTKTLQGSIQANLTEETGSILAGAFNGMRLSLLNIEGVLRPMAATQINIHNLAQQNLNQAVQIQINTFRTANNTDQLYRLEKLEELTGVVARNTGDTLGLQLRAAGKG